MLYAIADLHLSHGDPKPMERFGELWRGHDEKIQNKWTSLVGENDTVIIAGDISWSMRMGGFIHDLEFIKHLPGRKIIVRGNHDYWWNSTNRLNTLDPGIFFLQNNFAVYEGIHICGTRGWTCPNTKAFDAHDEKIYKREAGRLKMSLEAAMRDGADEIIAVSHFPPFSDINTPTLFTDLLEEHPIKTAVYGHLHGGGAPVCQTSHGITYRLVSVDYTNFTPIRIR